MAAARMAAQQSGPARGHRTRRRKTYPPEVYDSGYHVYRTGPDTRLQWRGLRRHEADRSADGGRYFHVVPAGTDRLSSAIRDLVGARDCCPVGSYWGGCGGWNRAEVLTRALASERPAFQQAQRHE